MALWHGEKCGAVGGMPRNVLPVRAVVQLLSKAEQACELLSGEAAVAGRSGEVSENASQMKMGGFSDLLRQIFEALRGDP